MVHPSVPRPLEDEKTSKAECKDLRVELRRLKEKLTLAIVDSKYAAGVKWKRSIRQDLGGFTYFSGQGELINRLGTRQSLYLQQPYPLRGTAVKPHVGIVKIPNDDVHFFYRDAEDAFRYVVEILIRNAGLPYPIELPHPRPVGNAPFDPLGERPEDFEERYMMDFEALKGMVVQMLKECGYSTEYVVGQDQRGEKGKMSVKFYMTMARGGYPGSIHLWQPNVWWGQGAYPVLEKGLLMTPYADAPFDCGNVREVFARLLQSFALRESREYIEKERRTGEARTAVLEACQAAWPRMDALMADVLHSGQEIVTACGDSIEAVNVQALVQTAMEERVAQSPVWSQPKKPS